MSNFDLQGDPDLLDDIFPRVIPGPSVDDDEKSSDLEKDATHYRMDHSRRGVAAIFYQGGNSGLVVNDVNSLSRTFISLGFDVFFYKDLTACQIGFTVEELSQRDHSDCDGLVVVYLGKGFGGHFAAKDKLFRLDLLWDKFIAENSPTLVNKPKMFIIQSYNEMFRGGNRRGLRARDHCGIEDDEANERKSYFIPNISDFLIVLSHVPGVTNVGSRYIQTLCRHLDTSADKDITTVLTEVNFDIKNSVNESPRSSCSNGKNQLPTMISLLLRILQFSSKTKRKKGFSCIENSPENESSEDEKESNGGFNRKRKRTRTYFSSPASTNRLSTKRKR